MLGPGWTHAALKALKQVKPQRPSLQFDFLPFFPQKKGGLIVTVMKNDSILTARWDIHLKSFQVRSEQFFSGRCH